MIEILDHILRCQNYLIGIFGIILIGYSFFNIRFINPWDKTVDRNEYFIEFVSNKWFYIPFSILIMIFITRMVVYDIYEIKVYAELIFKIDSNQNRTINFKEYEIIPFSKNNRFYTDKEFRILLDTEYEIELKRNSDDTTSYYIFVPKYFEASYNTIAYITKKPLQN